MVKEKIKGLGGWLILPILGLILGILFLILDIFVIIGQTNSLALDSLLIFIDGAQIILFSYTLYLIFSKKKSAPKFAIACYIVSVIVNVGIGIFVLDITKPLQQLIMAILWTAYFMKSERVKNTFVK